LPDLPQPFWNHLEELRRRLLIWLATIPFLSVLGFFAWTPFLNFLAKPVGTIIFTHPAEAFLARFKVAGLFGLFLSSPVAIYQTWRFIVSGLKEREQRLFLLIVPASCLLFFAGVALAVFLVVPAATGFLIHTGSEHLKPLLSLDEYLSFMGWTSLSFGLAFQTPIAITSLCALGILNPDRLAKRRREAILIILMIGAIITPGPDIFSQLSVAIPCYLLYELSLALSRRIQRSRSKTTR
jgi:sec-independent protein translocase protein TatC